MGGKLGLALAAALALTACSSTPTSRPDVDALETQLWTVAKSHKTETKQSIIHCQAERLHESSVSDEGLRAFVGDAQYELNSEEKKSLAPGGSLWVKLQTCQQNS